MHMLIALFHLPDLERRGSFPLWLAIVLGLAAMIGVIVLYAREAGRLGIFARSVMASVRLAIVAVVVFLLLRPVLVTETKEERSRPIGILIDVSKSMDTEDPRPNSADQWRVAMAYGFADADKGLPAGTPPTSLNLKDRPKRIEVAREALKNSKIGFFPKLLLKAAPLEVYTFGAHRAGRSWTDTSWLDTLEANEPQSRIVESAFDLLNRDDNDAPAALVIVTDGRENSSSHSLDELARECARRKIPIHVYGVGSSSFAHLQVKDVMVPETIFVDDQVAVPVRYAVKGVKEGLATIVLHHGGREVARKERIPVKEGNDLRETLFFTPNKEDTGPRHKQELTATVTITTGRGAVVETLTDEMVRPAQVVDKKLKVLVIDSVPRFDFKFLQRALLRDRRVEAKFYLTEGDKTAMRSGEPWMIEFSRELNGTLNMDREEFRKTLFEFDLLILGAVPGKYFNLEQQGVIREFVTEGGGLIHIAGRSYTERPEKWVGPAAWAGEWEEKSEKGQLRRVAVKPPTPIGELLPVEFEAVRMPVVDPRPASPFVPVLAASAARSPLVSLEDDPLENLELWGKFNQAGPASEKQLKPFYWYYPVLKTKPAADVYLVHPTAFTPEPDHKPMPLLVGHFFGKGYVLFAGFDDTWRWRFNSAEKYFGRFWSQAVYTAGLPRTVGTKLTQLSIDNPDPLKGSTGQIYARVFNENFKLLTADEIEATLEKVDADVNDKERSITVKLHKLAGQDGEYIATLPFNTVGRFRLTVDPKNKTPASLEYRVNYPPNHEQAPGGLDEENMRKLCEASGGKFYREEDLHQLPSEVKTITTVSVAKRERLLWNVWSLVLLIGLFTLEWVLRKFNGLS